ncbi:hypothetical protein [Microbacterium phyllosphaerae]|uniref:hypothetical protein n=1 Tax=Microbacterium phyllosphaerae TaxID=124798 RepID=UPI0021689D6D|nr:hypothetical protein [Microbacterium phyllosphaerae]MCS3444175.1 beta-galactosidase/beta-glucuronidase [Microbacterium phyllosphaerae]
MTLTVFSDDWTVGRNVSVFSEITGGALHCGEENRLRVDARAHRDSRWNSGLGIHRDVGLLDTRPTHLVPNGVRLTTPDIDESCAVVEARTQVANDGMRPVTVQVRTRIFDPDGALVAEESSPITLPSRCHRRGLPAALRRRTATVERRQPRTASVETELLAEDAAVNAPTTPLGIRRLQLDPIAALRIKGETVKLRGTCLHHDNGMLGAVSVADAECDASVSSRKPVSTLYGPPTRRPDPHPLDACDRRGMLVIDEAFDMWTEGKP